ncbi:MAG: aminoacyl-histidine dipeptidase [Prosthecochloris sp.]|nr:aminoacyl-histidine dipeptidase [Prosthecochloris sp.]
MNVPLSYLEPQPLWRHFYRLTQIPRPSGHEEHIRSFMSGFGTSLGLHTSVDDAGNVLIRKPATPGMEHCKGVILQAHLDMVPEKESDSPHDFRHDPLTPFVDGEWVRARGTTLGADNGIGVAAIMSILESSSLPHGPLEALLTSNEENGMSGAFGLRSGLLQGDILLNLDSEDEGELFTGCAGGLEGTVTFTCGQQKPPADYRGYDIRIRGLKGGHSGMDIHLGRGNANKIMNRLLFEAYLRHGILLGSLDGGGLRNAIARESTARIAIPSRSERDVLATLERHAGIIRQELSTTDPGMEIEAEPAPLPDSIMDDGSLQKLLRITAAFPDGVMRMSHEMPGLVETSNNLASMRAEGGRATIACLLRSSVDSARDDLQRMIESIAGLAGAEAVFDGAYPGWKPDPESEVLQLMQHVYEHTFGHSPQVRAVHAGLECGIIGAACPGLDMISFGPTIRSPHSPDERVRIASVSRFMDLLTATLAEVPAHHTSEKHA